MSAEGVLGRSTICYKLEEGTSNPYYYIGPGEVLGQQAERFVEAPAHLVDSRKEIMVLGIRGELTFRGDRLPEGDLPYIAERFAPDTEEHTALLRELEARYNNLVR